MLLPVCTANNHKLASSYLFLNEFGVKEITLSTSAIIAGSLHAEEFYVKV
jgi:hypothetical protein